MLNALKAVPPCYQVRFAVLNSYIYINEKAISLINFIIIASRSEIDVIAFVHRRKAFPAYTNTLCAAYTAVPTVYEPRFVDRKI